MSSSKGKSKASFLNNLFHNFKENYHSNRAEFLNNAEKIMHSKNSERNRTEKINRAENTFETEDAKCGKNKSEEESKLAATAREMRKKKTKQLRRYPFGKVQIKVNTENTSRLYSTLKKEGVIFPKSYESGSATFFCYARHSAKIIALLDRLCYNYQVIGYCGALPALAGALARVGVTMGAILAITAVAVYPKFVIKIVLDGTLTKDAVSVLSEYGVVEGAFLPSIDTAAIEDRLLALDGVSFASVVRQGTRVYVTLREELDKEYFLSAKGNTVAAKKDCVISRVIVYDGTAIVKTGDKVKAGQTLIEPYLLVREEQIPSRADGEVYGTTICKKTMFFPNVIIASVEGKEKSITKLSFFGKVPKSPDSPYDNFRVSLTVTKNNYFIPYKVYNWTFTELKSAESINALTDADMRRKTMSCLTSQLPAGATLISYQTESAVNELGVSITAIATIEECVS